MAKKRKQYSNDFKFKVAFEAIKGVKIISQLASDYNSVVIITHPVPNVPPERDLFLMRGLSATQDVS